LLQAGERPLSSLMHALGLRYARWFNDRWAHCGHLFQGRYYSGFIAGGAQAMLVLRYIHLNPMLAALVVDPIEHRWSSHRAYSGSESPPHWLTTHYLLSLLGPTPAAARQAYAQLMSAEVTLEDLRPEVAAAPPPRARHRLSFDRILDVVAKEAGSSSTAILGHARDHRTSLARAAAVHVAREIGGYPLAELARLLGRAPATLYNGVARRTARPTLEWKDLMDGVRLSLSPEKEIGNT
jgi:hypothetical protein